MKASDFTFCVDETNRYRAMRSRPALARSATIEQFAGAGAKSDGLANVPHQHVLSSPFPGGGHYENLIGPYTEIGCGIHVDSNGITIIEDFR